LWAANPNNSKNSNNDCGQPIRTTGTT
jgi:hypothetical protein